MVGACTIYMYIYLLLLKQSYLLRLILMDFYIYMYIYMYEHLLDTELYACTVIYMNPLYSLCISVI